MNLKSNNQRNGPDGISVIASRNRLKGLLLVIFISLACTRPCVGVEMTREKKGLEKLIDQIFNTNTYNELVRPVNNNTGLTHVSTELKLLGIDLDEKYQELVSTVWVEMSWEDSRLQWKPSDYDNVTEITLPVTKLWTPDIVLQNGVGRNEYLNEFKYFNPWISHTGIITWVPEVRLHTRCLIKVSDFPFDTQCCEINFYSWAHTIKQMEIKQFGDKNVTNITHLSHNTEWEVYSTCALSKVIVTSEELHWWMSSYIIYIKRHTAYHIYNLLMPCLILSMLSMLLFLLPPDSGEKVTLGVTVLLAFFVNSLVVSNYTPESTSELPVIGIYYVFNIGFVSLSVGTTVCVLNFHFRGHKLKKVPAWLKKILLIKKYSRDGSFIGALCQTDCSNLANLNCFDSTQSDYNESSVEYTGEITEEFAMINSYKSGHNHKSDKRSNHCDSNGKYSQRSFPVKTLQMQKNMKVLDAVVDCNHTDKSTKLSTKLIELKPLQRLKKSPLNDNIDETNKASLEKIFKLIKKSSRLLEKNAIKTKAVENIYDEWKETAARIDQILFIISLLVVTIVPIYLFGKFVVRGDSYQQNHNCVCQK